MMTTRKAFVGTRPAASLHWRSVAKDATGITVTYATSSASEMHVAELKADPKIRSVKRKNSVMKGKMITIVLTMTNLTGAVTGSGTHPRRHQGIFPRPEAGLMASELQAIKDREIRWVHQFDRMARGVLACH
jgi:hypothetical protein